MAEMSARIVAFPVHPGRSAPADRLNAAPAGLGAALARQKVEVASWQRALTELGGQLRATETALLAHNDALGTLRQGVATLHDRALQLQRTMPGAR